MLIQGTSAWGQILPSDWPGQNNLPPLLSQLRACPGVVRRVTLSANNGREQMQQEVLNHFLKAALAA
jgi:hypothetical protein